MQNRLNKLIDFARTRLQLIEKLLTTILTYNNLEFLKSRQKKRIEKIQRFCSIILIIIFESHNFNTISLFRSM